MTKQIALIASLMRILLLSGCVTTDTPSATNSTLTKPPATADISQASAVTPPRSHAQDTHQTPAPVNTGMPAPPASSPATMAIDKVQLTGFVEHLALTEISGLETASQTPGVLFAVNDSGNASTLYAMSETGKHLSHWPIDAHNRDWEDIATATINGKPYLVLSDTGDNRQVRSKSVLYFIEEPSLDTPQNTPIKPTRSLRFTYEDGPRNVEALGIIDHTAYLITKEPIGPEGPRASRLYELDLTERKTNALAIARFTAELPLAKSNLESRLAAAIAGVDLNHPTALDFDSHGKTAYLLTYRHVLRIVRSEHQSWAKAFSAPATRIHSHTLRQAEALAVANDNTFLWFTSEHRNAPLWVFPLRPPL